MDEAQVLCVKKFMFPTYDVFLEVNRKFEGDKPVYWFHKYAQNHPIKDRNVQPYNEVVSIDYSSPCEAVFAGYESVEIFPRKNKKTQW